MGLLKVLRISELYLRPITYWMHKEMVISIVTTTQEQIRLFLREMNLKILMKEMQIHTEITSLSIQLRLVSHHAIVTPNPTTRDKTSKQRTGPSNVTRRNLILMGQIVYPKQRPTHKIPAAQQSPSAMPSTTLVQKMPMIPKIKKIAAQTPRNTQLSLMPKPPTDQALEQIELRVISTVTKMMMMKSPHSNKLGEQSQLQFTKQLTTLSPISRYTWSKQLCLLDGTGQLLVMLMEQFNTQLLGQILGWRLLYMVLILTLETESEVTLMQQLALVSSWLGVWEYSQMGPMEQVYLLVEGVNWEVTVLLLMMITGELEGGNRMAEKMSQQMGDTRRSKSIFIFTDSVWLDKEWLFGRQIDRQISSLLRVSDQVPVAV